MRFHKYHALGNDYLVMDPADGIERLEPTAVRKICHRNYGVGSDGILHGPLATNKGDFGLRIWNPDGSEAEKSGNGLRIFSRFLLDSGRVQPGRPFTVDTPGGRVRCEVNAGGARVTVEMGRVSFDAAQIPVSGVAGEVLGQQLTAGEMIVTYNAATIGNPHCVVARDEVSAEEARALGPQLENHPIFPNRTNVQFLQVLDRNNIRIEIWERGAGYTLASGSSSSAAAAVAHRLGLCDRDITVHMPGGNLRIQIAEDYAITMTGPVTRVAAGEIDDELFTVEI